MADQKELKKRLKVLMNKPENQVCSDCPERQPRWASLIVAPPGSPPGTLATGAFCCLECSGSHRRLGVHISFVRSINLDSWKEKEVLAMENGGNKKVNAIWEANLARAGGQKPPSGADLTTRERYIRDKYERRKFFDMDALVNYQNNEPSFDDLVPKGGADFANFADAPVSDAAKARAEKKKKKAPSRHKSFEGPTRTKSSEKGKRSPKKTPVPAAAEPAVADLLDFGAVEPTSAPAATNGDFGDLFSPAAAQNGPAAGGAERQGGQDRQQSGTRSRRGSRSRSKNRSEMRTKSKTPDREKVRKSQQQDILNMYNNPMGAGAGAAGGMGPVAMGNNNNSNQQANMMAMMQQMQNMNMGGGQPGFGGTGGMPGATPDASGGGGGKHNSRLQMHQNLMMQQMQSQMQQQQRNLQQMQRLMQQNPQMMQHMQQLQAQMQQQQQGAGMMNPQMMMMMNNNNNQNNKNNMGGMPNMMGGGMPNMMGNNSMNMSNSMTGMNPNMMMANPNMMGMMQQPNMMNNSMSSFGAMPPMMGGAAGGASNPRASATTPKSGKDDPFAQFGTNAFR